MSILRDGFFPVDKKYLRNIDTGRFVYGNVVSIQECRMADYAFDKE